MLAKKDDLSRCRDHKRQRSHCNTVLYKAVMRTMDKIQTSTRDGGVDFIEPDFSFLRTPQISRVTQKISNQHQVRKHHQNIFFVILEV